LINSKLYRGRLNVTSNKEEYLVVEIDGPQHNEKRDAKRDEFIQSMGYRILRIPIYILSQNPQMIIEEIKKLT